MLHRINSPERRFELIILVVINTDCTCSCESNYHTITITTTPIYNMRSDVHVIFILLMKYYYLIFHKMEVQIIYTDSVLVNVHDTLINLKCVVGLGLGLGLGFCTCWNKSHKMNGFIALQQVNTIVVTYWCVHMCHFLIWKLSVF